MKTIEKLFIVTLSGLTVLGGGVALAAKSMEAEPAVNAKQAIDIAFGTSRTLPFPTKAL